MKKLNLLFAFCFALLSLAQAQIPPNAFNYSAVARNAAGQPIATTTIGIQISILKTTTTGTVQYSENHFVNTDAFGLFNLVIGAGAVQTGSMSAITWGTDNYYIKVGMDAKGGANFLTMGTTQLLSVPYALHAKTAESIVGGGSTNTVGKTYIELFGDITNAQADSIIKADLGPNTQFVYITNTTKLTSIDLTAIKALMELSITGNEVLTTVNVSSLTRCTKNFDISTNPLLATIQTDKITFLGNVTINKNPKLTALNFPVLKKALNIYVSENPIISSFSAVLLTIANDINFNKNGLTNISFPVLITLSGSLIIQQNTLLTTLSISSLTSAKDIGIYSNGLTSLNFSGLTSINLNLGISNNTSLTSLTTSSLISSSGISIQGTGLTSLSFPALTTINGEFSITNNASLTSLTVPLLTTVGQLNSYYSIRIENNGLTNLSFPALTTLNGRLNIENNASMTSLSLPSLTTVNGEFSISSNASMTSLSFPLLNTVNSSSTTYIDNNALLNTVNISSLSNFQYLNVIDNKNLKNISWAPQITSWSSISLSSNALPSSEINEILALVVTSGQSAHKSSNSLDFQNQTPLAPPTGQGITDKATIVGWGISVSTD